jgi:hypothetical protein
MGSFKSKCPKFSHFLLDFGYEAMMKLLETQFQIASTAFYVQQVSVGIANMIFAF